MSRTFAQKIHEQDVDFFKNWLCDNRLIDVRQGLDDMLSNNNSSALLKEIQIRQLGSKLLKNLMPTMSTITDKNGFKGIDGIVKIDDIVTLISNFNAAGMLGYTIRSRPQFVKLIYQYISSFPVALYVAYKEVTGENLILDDLSEIREFYESYSKLDLWTGHELCAYISHCDPEILDFISKYPKIMDFMLKQPENLESMAKNPKILENMSDKPEILEYVFNNPRKLLLTRLSRIFTRTDLYEKNMPLVKAAILGEAFELIHLDRENWEKSTLNPKKGLEWAKKKGIDYHPVLDEYLLDIKPVVSSGYTTSEISSGYITPYLDMMGEVIKELELSKDNQGKKEAIAALFEQKLADHKATPLSQKLADAMATLVRLPESQQGRAKRKG